MNKLNLKKAHTWCKPAEAPAHLLFALLNLVWFLTLNYCRHSCRTSKLVWTTWTTCSKWNQRTRLPWSCCRRCRRSDDASGTLETAVRICHCPAHRKERNTNHWCFYKSQPSSDAIQPLEVRNWACVSQKLPHTELVFDLFTLSGTNMSSVSRRFWKTQLWSMITDGVSGRRGAAIFSFENVCISPVCHCQFQVTEYLWLFIRAENKPLPSPFV